MPSHYEQREQTQVKHKILERYLQAFIPIVGDWAGDISYIDCCAGPWKSVDPSLSDTSFARAIGVIREAKNKLLARGKNPTIRCLLIEKDPQKFEQLNQYRTGINDVDVRVENWDFTRHISDIVRFAQVPGRVSIPFMFIDPTGWEQLEVSIIAPLLRLERGEVLINFMTSFIKRFLSDETKRPDRLVGDDVRKLVALHGEEREDELVRSFGSNIRKVGLFNYVCSMPVMKSTEDAFHFYMVYATRNAKGVEEFKRTEKAVTPYMHGLRAAAQERKRVAETRQPSLYEPQAMYSESRFSRFRQKNLELAKGEVKALLTANPTVRYGDAWLTAMQFSAVMEDDLRQWIDEWCANGVVTVLDKKPNQKVLTRQQNQVLRWIGS